jgi:hypothetical protein
MSTSALRKTNPLATAVAFHDDLVEFTLADGRVVGAPIEWFPRLRDADANQLRNWRLIGGGVGVHWAELDEDISVKSMLAL